MNIAEYESYDALGLAELVRTGEVSAEELLDSMIERIEAHDVTVNAVVTAMFDEARACIAAGLPTGPFTGVPFMLKDLNLFYAGARTTNGSAMFADYRPDFDSTLVERYRAAGLVIAGKTNTPEFGIAATTEPTINGSTANPWKPGYSPGGSSGGAAAAVAAGYLPVAHATDGGGSIRIPASNCGLFGLKPTRGRTPNGPLVGEGMAGMSTGHCVSRSVRDSAALLDATGGPAPGDPYAAPRLARPLLDEVQVPPGQLRIALCTTDYRGGEVHPECVGAARATAVLCEELGHVVEEARPDLDEFDLIRAWRVIPAANLWNIVHGRAKALAREPRPRDVEPVTWAWMQESQSCTSAEYLQCVTEMHMIGRRTGAFLERYDFLLTPTMGCPPIRVGEMDMGTEDVDRYVSFLFEEVAPFTPLFNQTGGAAMSLPLHESADGLPIGVQFGGRLGDEPKLIRLAAQIEQARPWPGRAKMKEAS